MNKEEIIRQWALKNRGAPYVYGGTGRRCTPEYRRERIAQYPLYKAAIEASCPVLSGTRDTCVGCRYEGRACFDCAQFTRGALQSAGMSIPSGASSQWRSDSWTVKGAMQDLPGTHVCVLYRESGDRAYPMAHAGLYLGDGYAMDARGHMQGIMHYPVSAYAWTHYAIPHGMNGPERPFIVMGERGERVRGLQTLLLQCAYSLPRYGADGVFGEETLAALQSFQRDNGFPVTPQADDTALTLLRDMAEKTAPETPEALRRRLKVLEDRLAACPTCAGKNGVSA